MGFQGTILSNIGYTSSPLVGKLAEGKVFASGAVVTNSTTLPGDIGILNPPTSGKILYVVSWSVNPDAEKTPIRYFKFSQFIEEVGGWLARDAVNLNFASPATSSMSVRWANQNGGLFGGTVAELPIKHFATPDNGLHREALVVVPPNVGLGFRIPAGLANSAHTSLQWYEEKI